MVVIIRRDANDPWQTRHTTEIHKRGRLAWAAKVRSEPVTQGVERGWRWVHQVAERPLTARQKRNETLLLQRALQSSSGTY